MKLPVPPGPPSKPARMAVDYDLIRQSLSRQVEASTGLTCILKEPERPNAPRPPLPYFAFKIRNPGRKIGDDSKDPIPDPTGKTNPWNSGGVRCMDVSFECYGRSHEEAYDYMALLQALLDTWDVQGSLRAACGISVMTIGTLADLSELLNTGTEGRSQMDCVFGVAANVSSDQGSIDQVAVQGQVSTEQGTQTTSQVVTGE